LSHAPNAATGWRPWLAALMALAVMAQAKGPTPLARARQAYNAGQFDAAIAAATDALKVPDQASAAAVVLGRSYLERYRRQSTASDLDEARKALQLVVPGKLAARDRIEFLITQGLTLYVDGCADGCFGGAAEMFKVALSAMEDGAERDRVFEWWAAALDRAAQFGPEADRIPIYRRLLDGADAELARHDQSASATYWVAAAARGAGDLERAWSASISAWVRSRSFGDRAATLRTDLDRFVTQVLLPERARALAPDTDARPMLATLLAQWEELRKKYPE